MSEEKKIREYAEERLAAFSGAENSLARLKAEQKEIAAEEALSAKGKERKKGNAFFRYGFALSAVAVVITVVCLFRFLPIIGGDLSSKESAMTKNFDQGSGLYPSESNAAPMTDGDLDFVNDRTLFLTIGFPASESADMGDSGGESFAFTYFETEGGEGYRFAYAENGSELQAAVTLDGSLPKDFSDSFDREAEIAGQRFLYQTDDSGIMRGMIRTEREKIFVFSFKGGSEEEKLALLRKIISEK